jgi:hypothetical protein
MQEQPGSDDLTESVHITYKYLFPRKMLCTYCIEKYTFNCLHRPPDTTLHKEYTDHFNLFQQGCIISLALACTIILHVHSAPLEDTASQQTATDRWVH